MTDREAAIRNAHLLVQAAVATLQGAGWSEAEIIAELPRLAAEAVAFLRRKAAA